MNGYHSWLGPFFLGKQDGGRPEDLSRLYSIEALAAMAGRHEISKDEYHFHCVNKAGLYYDFLCYAKLLGYG